MYSCCSGPFVHYCVLCARDLSYTALFRKFILHNTKAPIHSFKNSWISIKCPCILLIKIMYPRCPLLPPSFKSSRLSTRCTTNAYSQIVAFKGPCTKSRSGTYSRANYNILYHNSSDLISFNDDGISPDHRKDGDAAK